jgi:3',5'-cyclic AMP phosphodiesterase CpdA
MSRLTWLHISDWHHGDFPIDPEVVRDELIKDIRGRLSISPDLSKIDFIVFSGDAAFNGKAEEYEDAKKEFFVPILEAAQVEPDRLFIVPGNHDLDEVEIKKLPDDFRKDIVSKEDADRWLKDDSKRELLLRPFKDFRRFVSGFTGQDSPDYSDLRTWEINGKTVSLLGINSSWFCRRHVEASGKQNDYGFARVGERQVHRPLERIRKSDLRIAVLHHSQDWLEYLDGQVVWRRLRRGCNFILHGHGHVPKVTAERETGGDCVIIPAGASFGGRPPKDPSRINSYNFVHINFETGKGFVFVTIQPPFQNTRNKREKWMTIYS